MVNTSYDTDGYDRTRYQRDIFNGNALYEAFLLAKRGSDWKPQVQKFEMTYLLELARMQRELEERTYEFSPTTEFELNERGKLRLVNGEQIRDRVVKHSLSDNLLFPKLQNFLIYDNGASIKGKGIDFTRKRLLTHLNKYYINNGSNEGYILLIDFSKYYDNIRHDVLLDLYREHIDYDDALWLLEMTLKQSEVDVSYLTDEEYEDCLNVLFNSIVYHKIDKALKTGDKFMAKHLNLGDIVSQNAGIIYPIPIDNYVKIVRGVKYYARYMDDSYLIHRDKEFLKDVLYNIIDIADGIGITVNQKKTRICKLSDYWRFLQIQYSLTDTGRIIKKINPKRLTCMRRKMKKIAPTMTEKDFRDFFFGWYNNHCKYMSKRQKANIKELYKKEVVKCHNLTKSL